MLRPFCVATGVTWLGRGRCRPVSQAWVSGSFRGLEGALIGGRSVCSYCWVITVKAGALNGKFSNVLNSTIGESPDTIVY